MPDTQNLQSILEYFYKWEETKANEVFLKQPFGKDWKTLTWKEAGEQSRKMVSALRAMGIEKGAHVGIYSKNCYHWILADVALSIGGYVSVPFYANLNSKQLTEVLDKSDAQALFVGKLDNWDEPKKGVPSDLPIIRFPHYPGNAKVTEGVAWDDLLTQHEPITGKPVPNLDDLWTILFTSGTTGTPKGVMLTHKAPALQMQTELEAGDLGLFKDKNHRFFSFLPLNHIAERMIVEGAALMSGGSISFAESLDTFVANLKDTQPTVFLAVPRIWTKFQLGILEKMPQKRLNTLFKIPIVSGMIKKRVATALGLASAKIVLTGAAPTSDDLKNWYQKIGISLREVYGMTETCGGATLMPAKNLRSGTVGKPMSTVQVKIEEGTGQILLNMPWKMLGYYKDPEKSEQVLSGGWLHTGDQGELDSQGFLKITGRVSDTFKTAKGKYVVPTPIEMDLAQNELIEQICLVGLALPQPIALVALSDLSKGLDKPAIEKSLHSSLKTVQKKCAKHEKPSTVVVMKEPWSVENAMLTPTLKVRRGEINKNYKEKFMNWHEIDQEIVWED